ncbi:protein odr-4 homolog isoform 2 [Mus musculus]|uniref:Isoform 3 of Protein odr-4 homolog n=1 Tax=Mus musculus TaxID=10090 RepID=Q4PJX1-3|nr:protein odr-4 homolog isoform 2 [Mus musculus]|eukprot:NP_001070705.1 protein odr-4 homolog isoform 2 [Mus musculus]
MGRTYIVEETVGQYLSSINLQGKPFVSGLLIGQCSSQKDYVILATRTPPKEEQNDKVKQPRAKLDNLDEEWATEHASQVSRMLPGGLVVLGIFIITTLELADDFQNALRRLIFSMEKSMSRKRLWDVTEDEVSERVTLHICSSTKKISCRTYDVQDPKSSARPADWKYQSRVSASWLSLDCTVHVNIHIPLSATSVSYTLEKNTKKKSRGNTQATAHSFDVRVLTQLLLNSDHRSTATVQICSGSVNLRGNVKCRAYIHSNRPKVKDAVQAVKRDILNTVADRCEILFEDLLLNEIPEKKNYELPQRVFVPLPGSTVMLCDYKFGDESAEEIRDHFSEMLDHEIQIEDLEIAEEVNTACMTSSVNSEASLTNTSEEQPEQPKKTIGVKIQQNIGVIAALAVAVLAAGISFHYFSD